MKLKSIKALFLLALFGIISLNSCKKGLDSNNAGALAGKNKKTFSSPVGDVVGKITVGYQGWFAAIGDGSPINIWWHWAPNASQAPSTNNVGIKSWPDMREYTSSYQTGFANLNNGTPAKLFSSFNDQTVNVQFQWMQQNNIDCAALQRFNPTGGEGPVRDAITAKVKTAAEATGRKFYIMYDITGWTNMQSEIKTDWTNKMSAYTSSSAYAKQNGKPVVCIWGLGFNDANHPFSSAVCLDVINWFKGQGVYIIGGVPASWRDTNATDIQPNFLPTATALNMISPWMIGKISNVTEANNFYNDHQAGDQAYCNANGIDYQPCVLPGDLQLRQRAHGDLMWAQFYNLIKGGAQGLYISMFDEYNEGNQIAKTTENSSSVPAGSNFLSLDEDGTVCSADYYLRLTGDGGRMLKGQIALTAVRPTAPVVGGSNPSTPPFGQTITIKGSNNLYVSSENGTQAMNCNRATAQGWEQFAITNAGNGKVVLQNSGKYVSSENGTQAITCNRTAVGPWEQFDWVVNADGTISLRGNNGAYISSEGGTQAMTCTRTTITATESFRINQ
ncbi:lectin [Mucilaginibacter sp. HC2]|uniref:lectin n=1 Tax=Mucilaginibacter inviolabilis TaxID=2714892 RepID=UPI00140E509C|nr:lectin [Mucilaginibacter inviolabilis]NHA03571.1 lectin [Mucilaginibacter inviolabilis]